VAAVLALVLVVVGMLAAGVGSARRPAGAVVVHQLGFEATVLGWTSWYGTYGMGALGWGWCIDHGIAAPDGAFRYAPASIDRETDVGTQAALAWVATEHVPTSAVDAAAVMLVLHDLRHARYPFGTIDVDTLSLANLGGFGGQEAAILAEARAIKSDALAHEYAAPITLTLTASPAPAGRSSTVVATLADRGGRTIPGMPVAIAATGASIVGDASGTTGADGRRAFTFVAASGPNGFNATARLPDPRPRVFGSTTVPAQRIIQPSTLQVVATASFSAFVPAPTTTTTTTTTTTPRTTSTTSTTSVPRTTTTTVPTTTTTTVRRRPSTSTTTSTATSTTSSTPTTTATTTSTTTTTTTAPPTPTSPPAPAPPTAASPGPSALPVTGTGATPLAVAGFDAVAVGAACLLVARRRRTHVDLSKADGSA
jgi:hypothetical protein